jgi:hypothetical protein
MLGGVALLIGAPASLAECIDSLSLFWSPWGRHWLW